MTGPFGGDLRRDGRETIETVAFPIAKLLAGPKGEPEPAQPLDATLLAARGSRGVALVHYAGDFSTLRPLERGDLAATLASLGPVLSALAALEKSGRAHGDLRPGNVWVGAGKTRLTFAVHPPDALELLGARLARGVDPSEVSWVAPEVLAGGRATAASDRYSFAAILHFLVTGRPPQGRVGRLPVGGSLRSVILRGLDPDPERRPSLEAFEKAMVAFAPATVVEPVTAAPVAEPAVATPPLEPPVAVPALDPGLPAHVKPPGVLLAEARALAAATAADPAPVARIARVVPLATAAPPASPDAPAVLHVSLVATPEGVPAERAAEEKRDTPLILNLLLLVGGMFVLAGAFWVVVKSLEALGEKGPFVLLVILTAAIAGAGSFLERRGNVRSGFALHALASQLLWADGAYLLLLTKTWEDPAPWALVSGTVATVTFALAIRRDSVFLSSLALVGTAVATVLCGLTFRTNQPGGAAIWALVCGAVLAGLAFVGKVRASDRVGLPPALGAVLFALASFGLGLATWAKLPIFSIAWPYVVAAVALGATRALESPGLSLYRACAILVLATTLTLTPIFQGAVTPVPGAYGHGAAALGVVAILAALVWRRITPGVQLVVLLAGVANATALHSFPLLAAALATAALGLAIRRRSTPLSVIGCVFTLAATLSLHGDLARIPLPETAVWLLVCALVQGALAVPAGRRAGDAVSTAPALFAAGFVLASFVAALAASEKAAFVIFSVAWPYGLAAVAASAAFALRRHELFGRGALVLATIPLTITPVFHASVDLLAPTAYLQGAVPVGLVLVLVAVFVRGLGPSLEATLALVGVAHVMAARSGSLTATVVAAAAFTLALRHRSRALSALASVAAAAAIAFLGRPDWLTRPEGPAVWTLAGATVLGLMALVSVWRVPDARAEVSGPPAALAFLLALASAGLALATLEREPVAFAIAWPYVVAAALAGAALTLHRIDKTAKRAALGGLAMVLVVTPVVHALADPRAPDAYRYGAAIAGLAVLLAGLFWPRVAAFRPGLVSVGLAHVTTTRSWAAFTGALALTGFALAADQSLELVGAASALAAVSLVLLGHDLAIPFEPGVDPAVFALASAAGLLVVAYFLARRHSSRMAAPPAIAAIGFAFTSFLLGLASYERLAIFSIAWPYGVALGVAAVAFLFARTEGEPQVARAGVVAGAFLLAVTPLFHAFVNGHAPAVYLDVSAVAGALVVALGLLWPRLARDVLLQSAVLAVGVAHATAARSPELTASALAAVAFAFAIRKRSVELSALAVFLAGVAFCSLGHDLWVNHRELAVAAALAAALVSAGMAVVGRTKGSAEVAAPPAIAALLWALVSHGAAFLVAEGPFAIVWPYVVIAATGTATVLLVRADVRPERTWAGVVSALLLVPTPTIQALSYRDSPGFLYMASLVGAVPLILAFRWKPLASEPRSQTLAILTGLASATIAPAILALVKLLPQDGDKLLRGVFALSLPELATYPLFYLSYVVVTSGVLIGLAVLFSREAERKAPYRALEVAGLVLFLGVLTVLSCARYSEYLYPTVLLAGGLALLATGAIRRHVLLVAVPSAVLIANLWFQWFAKLWATLPLGWLLMGFGVSILAAGAVFEFRVRRRIEEFRAWG